MHETGIFSIKFLENTGERVIRSFAASLLATLFLGKTVTGLIGVDWKGSLSIAGFAALMSLLFAIGGSQVGDPSNPSLLK
jgi:Putative lactococcus lactis phage r1t holin